MKRCSIRSYLLLFTILVPLFSCRSISDKSNLSSDPTNRRAMEIHDSIVSDLNRSHAKLKDRLWFDTTADFNPDWLVQTPADYWGKAASELPKNLACNAGAPNCDAKFLRTTCNVDADCAQFQTTCKELLASVSSPGQSPTKMCLGSGDELMDRMYQIMVSANDTLDMTSLSPPTGRGNGLALRINWWASRSAAAPSSS